MVFNPALWQGSNCLWWQTTQIAYAVMVPYIKCTFYYFQWESIYFPKCDTFGNLLLLEFCHDSLNPAKVSLEELQYSRAGEAEWYIQCCSCRTDTEPILHQYLRTCLQVHESKSLDCHADLYTVQVNLKESTQGIHPGLETQGRHHPKSKTRYYGVRVLGYQGISNPTEMTYILQFF